MEKFKQDKIKKLVKWAITQVKDQKRIKCGENINVIIISDRLLDCAI